MHSFDIALLPGDQPGPAILDGVVAALVLLEKRMKNSAGAFSLCFAHHDIGLAALKKCGDTLPQSSLEAIRKSDAALVGMIDRRAEQEKNAIGAMRRKLMLYADVRPVKPLGDIWALKKDIDIVCIRESTEGFLADRNMWCGSGEMMPAEDVVISMRVVTRQACRRIAEFAFAYARSHGRRKITVAHKASVLRMGCGFFLDVVRETAKRYPDILLDDDFVDSVAHRLIAEPETFDILLATNLMGDIVSDEASALVSGMTGAANIGDGAAVFFPVKHLVDAEHSGAGTVNPVPMYLCGVLMLSHLGLHEAAADFERIVASAATEAYCSSGSKEKEAERFGEAVRRLLA